MERVDLLRKSLNELFQLFRYEVGVLLIVVVFSLSL